MLHPGLFQTFLLHTINILNNKDYTLIQFTTVACVLGISLKRGFVELCRMHPTSNTVNVRLSFYCA